MNEKITVNHFPGSAGGGDTGKIFGSENTVLMNTPFRGFDKIDEVYFLGIGGIGMSAIARFFFLHGVKVSGYDKTVTALTRELEKSGIAVHYEEDTGKIPGNPDLVVYTPAIPGDHKELVFYREKGVKVMKRSEVLQIITESSFNICIAGTHGKTTITTMVAHLLRDSGFGCNAFLGGISVNYGTNFWSSERNVCVIEADEYDRSFLKLDPDVAVVTAMDADHLDIYGTAEAVKEAFVDFSRRVKKGGLLLSNHNLERGKEMKADTHWTYSLQNENADIHAKNIRMLDGAYEFDVVVRNNRLDKVRLNMGGMHNVENAIAAMAVASSLGIENEKIRKSLESFRGVKRRFEYIIKTDRLIFIDDYAHHPEELKALIRGAKSLFRDKPCTVVFQPHLYTRTRDLADGFAEALNLADHVWLLPIYPARELPIEGVSSHLIAEKMETGKVQVIEREKLVDVLQNAYKKNQLGVLVTAGAGDIDMLIEPIKESLK